jgi:DNA cross-link repair 1A protein
VEAGDSSFTSPFIGSSRTFRYLHCGDFRASPRHVLHPAVKGKNLHHVYLDTTYLDPKVWELPVASVIDSADVLISIPFPPQPQVISACAELAHRLSTPHPQPKGPGSNPQRQSFRTAVTKNPGKVLIVIGSVFHLAPEASVFISSLGHTRLGKSGSLAVS